LAEDLVPLGDLTAALIPPTRRARAAIVAREAGCIAGMACVVETFTQVDPALSVKVVVDDGGLVEPGTTVAEVTGPFGPMLTAERTALNFLGHLSGIATLTRRYVDAAAAAGPTQIWDTRKTTPGLRTLEKAAVRAGGARNHRGNLSEWILLKDNHIAGVGIGEAVRAARTAWPGRTVQVECDRLDQMIEAIEAGADAVLLDNMDPDQAAQCVAAAAGRCLTEISGGVTLETVAAYAATGADMISIGRITNSAPVLDLGLDVISTEDVP
jgi:nicotinate-nucleotide pyrophosphorylase (carboxylating)